MWGGGALIPGTSIDERRRAIVVGHLTVRDFINPYPANVENMVSS